MGLGEYTFKGRRVVLALDASSVAVRFREPARHSTRARVAANAPTLGAFANRFEIPEENYTVFDIAGPAAAKSKGHSVATAALAANGEVVRVAPVFRLGSERLVATDRVIVGFKHGTQDAGSLAKGIGAATPISANEFVIRLTESADPFDVIEELGMRPEVEYAEPDMVRIGKHLPKRESALNLNDPLLSKQYAMAITKATDAWHLATGTPSIRIAILDEGVDTRHDDLADAIAGSYDAVDNDEYQEPNPWDGHGTACAGLAAAIQSNDRGIRGVAGGCQVLAVRIAYSAQPNGNWVTSNSWIAKAIEWSWRNGADVLSNSWGGGAESNAIANAFERARTLGRAGRGCVIVIAAGNDNGPVSFPATVGNVLAVAASNEYDEPKTKTSRDGEFWWGSNFGPQVSVAAPGVHNYTTDVTGNGGYAKGPGGDYFASFNGTSSATPIVAGAAALVLAANPALVEKDVREIICSSADKVGPIPYSNGHNERMGYGRLNVRRAVEIALGQQPGNA